MKLAWVVSLWALTGLALVNSTPIKLEIEVKKAGPYPERHSDSFGNKAKWFAKQLASEGLHSKHPRNKTALPSIQGISHTKDHQQNV